MPFGSSSCVLLPLHVARCVQTHGCCEHDVRNSVAEATDISSQVFFAKRLFYLEYPSEAPADVCYSVMRQTLVLHTPSGGYYGSPGSLLSALSFFVNLASLPMDARVCLLEMGRKDTFQQCRLAAVVLRADRPTALTCSSLDANLSCGTSLRLAMFGVRA